MTTPERAARTQVWLSEADTQLCDQIRMAVGALEGRPTPPRTEVVREGLRLYNEALQRAQRRAQTHRKEGP